MGHRGHHDRQRATGLDALLWQAYESRGRGDRGRGGGRGRWDAAGGPPPWVAGLFGMGQPERGRGPRVRRGDVRSAILDVLATDAGEAAEPLNGYQVIQQIAERSNDAWRPSPGSVYPTIQQLQDEGLVDTDDEHGRRALRLTDTGRTWVHEHADELAAVWAPFARAAHDADREQGEHVDLKSELGQVMPAIWQIATQGSSAQRRAAMEILADTRRKLYGVLADGPDGLEGPDEGEDA